MHDQMLVSKGGLLAIKGLGLAVGVEKSEYSESSVANLQINSVGVGFILETKC